MKITTPNTKYSIIQRSKPFISLVFIILLASLSTACQLTAPLTNPTTNLKSNSVKYSQYYLWLKTLSNEQLLLEEQKQASLMSSQLDDKAVSQGKLILLYSLPSPVLHQPYKAKRLLNEHLLVSNNMSQDNVAFTMLLRDQLNSQLNLLEKQARANKAFSKQHDENNAIIEQLTQQVNLVNQQLLLLKKIDQNINKRG